MKDTDPALDRLVKYAKETERIATLMEVSKMLASKMLEAHAKNKSVEFDTYDEILNLINAMAEGKK